MGIRQNYLDARNAGRAVKNVTAPNVRANKDASQTLFGKLTSKAKPNGVVSKLTSNVGYKTVKEPAGAMAMDAVDSMKTSMVNQMNAIDQSIVGATDQAAIDGLSKTRGSLGSAVGRADGILKDKSFERGMTAGEYMKDYYGNEQYGKFRKGATAGALLGTAAISTGIGAGVRYGTGGDMTHRGDGKKDIFGVPFF